MKNLQILICEDNQIKAKAMLRCMEKFFEYGIKIDVSYYLNTSLDNIEDKKYNLIFIDINMKESIHGNYDQSAGIKILNKIEQSYTHDYECILCTSINDMKDLLQPYKEKYEILDYTYTHSDNDILEDNIKTILIEKSKKLGINLDSKQYDIAIITALQDEMTQVRNAFDIYETKIATSNGREKYDWIDVTCTNETHIFKAMRIEKINGKSISLISASAVKMGMSNTAVLATKIILKYKPKVIVMLGICAGKEGDIELGDILIADRVFDYQAGKVKQKGKEEVFYPDPDMYSLNSTFLAKFDDKKDAWTNDIANYWKKSTNDKTRIDPGVKIGLIGSGAAVMAKDNTFMDIEDHNRKILGIDMEAFALFVAAEKTISINKPIPILIKSVQDFADKKKDGEEDDQKKDYYRQYGSFSSAIFFLNLCHEYLIDYIEQGT
ncbi:hypothetical protein CJ673_05885 [Aliarcobacter cryaerophilus]|uniref:Nucleoside phosphorylase domain-containing protein n=1 Tax=Aliarcobacter cryaerophilus TaxID=28198 RepID=A0A2S9T8B9_9BACT|nr:response regulator [Aliarcobacter cryaerophilus]PRM95084.1 hypothetical protein CJ673_05885 [Aliarcobacter cryaerophilus]